MSWAGRLGSRALMLRGFLPLVAGLGIWELLLLGDTSPFFPPPSEWVAELRAEHTVGEIATALWETMRTLVVSLLIATLVGSTLGIAIGYFRVVRMSLSTVIEFLRALPSPVIVPIAMLALGQGEAMKVFAVSFAATWPVLLNAASTAGSTSRVLLDVATTFRLGTFDRLRKIVLPGTVPSILLGVRVALPVALIVTILVEMLSSGSGIGAPLIEAQREYRSASAFGLLFVVGIFGYALNILFNALQTLFLRRWPEG
jgi:ABC-type nitrate/sulfonate/bicarbonate transport system permease component